jgi:hypothetical protein
MQHSLSNRAETLMTEYQSSQAIACALTPGAYQERLAWIRALTRDAVLGYDRRDLSLAIRYDARFGDRVRDMVRMEASCCGFLKFDLREVGTEMRLTIEAPENARLAADELFNEFIASEQKTNFLPLSHRP